MEGAASTGLFCSHRKLRTTCPECRPPPPPPRPEAERKTRPRAKPAADGERPKRSRVKPPTRKEAENAEAWWVRGSG